MIIALLHLLYFLYFNNNAIRQFPRLVHLHMFASKLIDQSSSTCPLALRQYLLHLIATHSPSRYSIVPIPIHPISYASPFSSSFLICRFRSITHDTEQCHLAHSSPTYFTSPLLTSLIHPVARLISFFKNLMPLLSATKTRSVSGLGLWARG